MPENKFLDSLKKDIKPLGGGSQQGRLAPPSPGGQLTPRWPTIPAAPSWPGGPTLSSQSGNVAWPSVKPEPTPIPNEHVTVGGRCTVTRVPIEFYCKIEHNLAEPTLWVEAIHREVKSGVQKALDQTHIFSKFTGVLKRDRTVRCPECFHQSVGMCLNCDVLICLPGADLEITCPACGKKSSYTHQPEYKYSVATAKEIGTGSSRTQTGQQLPWGSPKPKISGY